eukprot:COSAG02_NODE_356_length_23978_cov_7.868504_19_plen_237_part_00
MKNIVNVVSPCSYYIQQTEPHALIRKKGADVLHKALLAAGFKVQPLVGDIGGGWNMSWYRDTFASDAFVKAAVKEIKEGSLEGLNFVRCLPTPTAASRCVYTPAMQWVSNVAQVLLPAGLRGSSAGRSQRFRRLRYDGWQDCHSIVRRIDVDRGLSVLWPDVRHFHSGHQQGRREGPEHEYLCKHSSPLTCTGDLAFMRCLLLSAFDQLFSVWCSVFWLLRVVATMTVSTKHCTVT